MKILKKLALFAIFFVLSSVMFTTYAYGYIDPGAMTYIIQLVAGVVIAAGAAFGFYWRRIVRFFTHRGAPSARNLGSALEGNFSFRYLFADEECFSDEYFLADEVLNERNAVPVYDGDDEDYWYFDDEDE